MWARKRWAIKIMQPCSWGGNDTKMESSGYDGHFEQLTSIAEPILM
jgi:hypothetical protein